MNPFIFGGRHSLKPLSSAFALFGTQPLLHFRLRHQIRSKVMACCSNDQFEPLTRTDLLLTELICQASTNRGGSALYNWMLVCGRAGVMSPKTELTQTRFQTSTWFLKIPLRNGIVARDFHGGLATSLKTIPADSVKSQAEKTESARGSGEVQCSTQSLLEVMINS